MLKQFKKRTEGFTIIEVLIVLAIAGLILLIVFLAVPALQRNSRDTSRKNDVSRILGAAQEVANNNGGQVSALTTTNVLAAAGNLGYYTAIAAVNGAPTTAANSDTTDTVTIYTGSTCGTGANAGKAIAGSGRQIAITYKIESAGGTLQCTNS